MHYSIPFFFLDHNKIMNMIINKWWSIEVIILQYVRIDLLTWNGYKTFNFAFMRITLLICSYSSSMMIMIFRHHHVILADCFVLMRLYIPFNYHFYPKTINLFFGNHKIKCVSVCINPSFILIDFTSVVRIHKFMLLQPTALAITRFTIYL